MYINSICRSYNTGIYFFSCVFVSFPVSNVQSFRFHGSTFSLLKSFFICMCLLISELLCLCVASVLCPGDSFSVKYGAKTLKYNVFT